MVQIAPYYLLLYSLNYSDTRCQNAFNVAANEDDSVTVGTRYGRVVGKISYLCDEPGLALKDRPNPNFRATIRRTVNVFLGIPYAKPPTRENDLRFKYVHLRKTPPQPPVRVGGVIDATHYQPACPQYVEYIGSNKNLIPRVDEDCLYMNIYSPLTANQLSSTLYPVMLYIHGGEYDHGSGNIFPGHMLAATQEVVVVTFNYRLGLLGFLATADNSSAGNYGMLDQIRAIEYIRENIRNFKGNPDMITLFGPGAGGASAGLLSLSPLSSKYIKRVIAQSGSAVAEWATIRDPWMIRNTSIVAGYTYGCRSFHMPYLVECLKSRSYTELTVTKVKQDIGWLPWGPVLDYTTRDKQLQFLPNTPEILLDKLMVNFPPGFAYMTGLTKDEGSSMVYKDFEIAENGHIVDQKIFNKKVADYIKIYNATLNPDALISAISFMYSPWTDPYNDTLIRQGLIDLISDSWFVAGADKMVKLMLKNRINTYLYVLNYTIEGLDWPYWMGVPHDTEYLFSSGAPFMDPKFYPSSLKLEKAQWSEADRNMSLLFMKSWADFAKFGNPTPEALFNTIRWQPMSPQTLQYLSVNTTNLTSIMHRDYRQKQSQFWNNYIPSLVGKAPVIWQPYYEPVEEELRFYRAATWAVVAALAILIFITALCSCLYCRAKRDRVGDAALDELDFRDIVAIGTQYSAPSTRANSEISLSMRPSRVEYPSLNKNTPRNAKYKAPEKASSNSSNATVPSSTFIFGPSMATSAV